MAKLHLLAYFFTIVFTGWSPALSEENQAIKTRVTRTLQGKLCLKLGICGGHQGGYDNHQGGYGGHQQGYSQQGGYGGQQGGYGGQQGGFYPYPPINIGISQSQSSASAGGGGFGSSSHPNNYQYNGGYPNKGGYNGHKRPGYFGNGYGSYNNQFNGNYYGGQSGNGGGGYGFQRPFGNNDDSFEDYGDYSRSAKSKD
ncbi:RNA-binding protein FUS-like [Maniola hyperantus]|uniref:RNA-binding protein FUS-like n=1 Tax=Aphantopus hyperantus TaxID=2795564 RepID=UPI00374A6873